VELQADGFYYNEVSNASSEARLLLHALSDLSEKSTLNVNLLSHLEKDRISYLIAEGMEFADAKAQAQQEVLKIFTFEKADMPESELLDISGEGDDHAILLAVSVILQGHRTVGQLSELLANIVSDLREDGILDDEFLGSALMNHAVLLDMPTIRQQLEARYATNGVEVTLPGFEKYVQQFINNSGYEITEGITYPEFSEYGENILYLEKSEFKNHGEYSMAADLPVGTSLKIRLSYGMWGIRISPGGPVNWKHTVYDHDNQTQTFTVMEAGKSCDLRLIFMMESMPAEGRDILVEYFENGSEKPTRSRTLHIVP
jgi:hypothetical protein